MPDSYFSSRVHTLLISGLRVSLGLIFFWFGALKIAGFNPVFEIVQAGFPFLAHGLGNSFLGAAEAAIGIALLINIFPLAAHSALVLHLIGTLGVFLIAPHLMFNPYFPMLSLNGEFVFKNISLAIAGLVVLSYRNRRD